MVIITSDNIMNYLFVYIVFVNKFNKKLFLIKFVYKSFIFIMSKAKGKKGKGKGGWLIKNNFW